MIAYQGDTHGSLNIQKKKNYSCEHCFNKTKELIFDKNDFPALKILIAGDGLVTPHQFIEDKTNPAYLTEQNLEAGMREGRIFFRGITNPCNYTQKSLMKSKKPGSNRVPESNAVCEVYKTMRRLGVATRSSDETQRLLKEGNPKRSTSSLIGRGTGTFCLVGFGIVNPKKTQIASHHAIDANTFYGSKKHMGYGSVDDEAIHNAKISQQLNNFIRDATTGHLENYNNSAKFYSEVIFHSLYDTDFNCIIFAESKNGDNDNISFLEAVYLQNVFEKHTRRRLPVFKYSGICSSFLEMEVTNEAVLEVWRNITNLFFDSLDCVHALGVILNVGSVQDMTLTNAMQMAVLKSCYGRSESELLSTYYSQQLQKEIEFMFQEKESVLKQVLITKIKQIKHPAQFYQFFEKTLKTLHAQMQLEMSLQDRGVIWNPVPCKKAAELFWEMLKQDSDTADAFFQHAFEFISKDFENPSNNFNALSFPAYGTRKNMQIPTELLVFLISLSQIASRHTLEKMAMQVVTDLVCISLQRMFQDPLKSQIIIRFFMENPEIALTDASGIMKRNRESIGLMLEKIGEESAKQSSDTGNNIDWGMICRITNDDELKEKIFTSMTLIFSKEINKNPCKSFFTACLEGYEKFSTQKKREFQFIYSEVADKKSQYIFDTLNFSAHIHIWSDFDCMMQVFKKLYRRGIKSLYSDFSVDPYPGLCALTKLVEFSNSDECCYDEKQVATLEEFINWLWMDFIKTSPTFSQFLGAITVPQSGLSIKYFPIVPLFPKEVYDYFFQKIDGAASGIYFSTSYDIMNFSRLIECANFSTEQWEKMRIFTQKNLPLHNHLLLLIDAKLKTHQMTKEIQLSHVFKSTLFSPVKSAAALDRMNSDKDLDTQNLSKK